MQFMQMPTIHSQRKKPSPTDSVPSQVQHLQGGRVADDQRQNMRALVCDVGVDQGQMGQCLGERNLVDFLYSVVSDRVVAQVETSDDGILAHEQEFPESTVVDIAVIECYLLQCGVFVYQIIDSMNDIFDHVCSFD